MTESNVEKLISEYLDSVYVISHSAASVESYKNGINHFNRFFQLNPLDSSRSETSNFTCHS